MGNKHRNMVGADRSRAVLMRDAALARVGRTRRWVIVGAAALTAGFAALVSAIAPGRSLASKTSSGVPASETASAGSVAASSSSSSRSSIPAMPPPASAGDLGLQSPGQAPAPDDQSQSQSAPSQPQPTPSQPQPQPAPAPVAPSSGVVSGGS
jgi:hypothetical protein